MNLTLELCTPDDVPAIVRLSAAAFSTPTPSNVFPDTPVVNAFRAKRALHSFNHDPFATFMKIIDTELPPDQQLIAMAKWAKPHTAEQQRQSGYVDLLMSDELPEECDRALIREAEVVKAKQLEDMMGDKLFYYLNVLATHPAHERRGCAGRLVKWGMERAEEESIECYVEAQDSSKPIFLKYGWKEVSVLTLRNVKRGTLLVYEPAKGTSS